MSVTEDSAVSLRHDMCCVLLADPGLNPWGSLSNLMVVLQAHFPPGICSRHGQKPYGKMLGVRLLRAVHSQEDVLAHETGARCRCHVDMSLIHDLCATLLWDLKGWLHSCHEICVEGRALWMSFTSQLFLVTIVQIQSLKAEGPHYAIGVIMYWSHFGTGGRSSERLFTVPRAAKEAVHCRTAGVVPWLTGGCLCQNSSVLSWGPCLPGQQCPQLQDLPCHRHPVLATYSSIF